MESAGRLFQIVAPVTAKFLLPSVVLIPATARQLDTADRRCRWLATEVTGTQSAARYGGASPCRHIIIIIIILYYHSKYVDAL